VRDDSGVYQGWEVPIHYDPMISKLATWGATREEAIARMRRALSEYHISGIRTTIPFFDAVLKDDEFRRGEIDTGFIARFFARQSANTSTEREESEWNDEQIAAAMAAALNYTRREQSPKAPDNGAGPLPRQMSKWKIAARLTALNKKQ
jgi:acetyl/propionyl-CoA carboxylase alpha subunit